MMNVGDLIQKNGHGGVHTERVIAIRDGGRKYLTVLASDPPDAEREAQWIATADRLPQLWSICNLEALRRRRNA